VAGQAKAALGRTTNASPFSPTLLVEGRMPPPSPYIKGPLEESPCACPLLSSLSLSLVCVALRMGCVGARATPTLHDEVLQKFWIGSKPIYFRNLGWIRIRKESSCTVGVRVLQGAAHAALSRCAGVVALVPRHRDLHDLEVGYAVFIVNACAGV
jgi:hypothetical protein